MEQILQNLLYVSLSRERLCSIRSIRSGAPVSASVAGWQRGFRRPQRGSQRRPCQFGPGLFTCAQSSPTRRSGNAALQRWRPAPCPRIVTLLHAGADTTPFGACGMTLLYRSVTIGGRCSPLRLWRSGAAAGGGCLRRQEGCGATPPRCGTRGPGGYHPSRPARIVYVWVAPNLWGLQQMLTGRRCWADPSDGLSVPAPASYTPGMEATTGNLFALHLDDDADREDVLARLHELSELPGVRLVPLVPEGR